MFDYSIICRTCLQILKDDFEKFSVDFVKEKRNITSIFNELFFCCPILDFHQNTKIVLCKNCFEAMCLFSTFSQQCNKIEDHINIYLDCINDSSDNFDFNKVLSCVNSSLNAEFNKPNIGHCSSICRTCLLLIDINAQTFPLNSISVYNKLQLCFSKLNLRIIPKGVMCKKCFETINIIHHFIIGCYKTEELSNQSIASPDVGYLLDVKKEINLTENSLQCEYTTKSELNLRKDMDTHKYFKCKYCDFNSRLKLDIEQHSHVHAVKTICKEGINTKRKLNQHLSVHTYKCSMCSKQYNRSVLLKTHIQTHSSRFFCEFCRKDFSIVEKLQHMSKQCVIKYYKCSVSNCNMLFNRSALLKTHMQTHSVSFICKFCGKGFNTKEKQKQHLSTYCAEKSYKCPYCKNRYKNKSLLKMHIKTHSFICKFCKKDFNTKNNLKQHLIRHRVEKLYKCLKCKNRYSKKSFLKRHMKTHILICKLCRGAFNTYKKLTQHLCKKILQKYKLQLKMNNETKLNKCPHCGYCCRTNLIFINHLKFHSNKAPLKCRQCNNKFSSNYLFRKHIRSQLHSFCLV